MNGSTVKAGLQMNKPQKKTRACVQQAPEVQGSNMLNPIMSEPEINYDESTEQETKQRVAELDRTTKKSKKKKGRSDKKKKEITDQEKNILSAKIVAEMNLTYAIIHTSSTYILIEKSETEFVLDTKQSLLNLFENQTVPELKGENSYSAPSIAQIWLKSPYRKTYTNIVFNPKIVGHYDGNFNMWKGFAIQPIKGDCSLFWDHIQAVICSGNKAHYLYVRRWLAHLVQKPWIIATALILRGKQGTGKGTFVDAIGKLFGSHYAPLANLDNILGKFNSHLKNAILIYADEAIWGGTKKEIGPLKALITEPKGKDGYWIDNFKHLIVSSNEDWAVHLDPDDRRFFVLDISNTKKEDIPYFTAIRQQLENGGYEALMYDLMHEDLTNFDPKIMPENFAGFDMKMESASSTDRFIYTSLKEECWDHANAGPCGEIRNLSIDTFYTYYKSWCERERQSIVRKEVLGKRLKKIIPGVIVKKTPREQDRARPSFYEFPSLEKCRSSFETFYKQDSQIWDWS